MGTRGYDDTRQIAEIEALMEANPGMSRKAAIRQVAGEGSVRRIEMKMSRRAFKAIEEAAEGEVSIQTGSNPTEMMLVTAERQALAGTGEKVRWSAFNDVDLVEERLRVGLLGPGYKERVDRMDRYCLDATGFVALFFVVMVAMLPIGVLGRLLGVPFEEISNAVSPVVSICAAGLVPSIIATISFALRAERIAAPYDRMTAATPVAPRETRRYVLTDKALYVLRPEGASVRVQRVDVSSVTGVEKDGEGDLVVRSRQSDVALLAVPNGSEVLSHLGSMRHEAATA